MTASPVAVKRVGVGSEPEAPSTGRDPAHGERYRPVRAGPLLGLVSGGLLVPVTVACPWIGVIVVLTPLTLLCCVVLPGVWSASPSRRRDARVMVELLPRSARRDRRPAATQG